MEIRIKRKSLTNILTLGVAVTVSAAIGFIAGNICNSKDKNLTMDDLDNIIPQLDNKK